MQSNETHDAVAVALLRVVQSHYSCTICYDVYHDPVALPCGHVFCRGCAERCAKERPHCPLCNGTISGSRVMTALPALQLFSTLVLDMMRNVATIHQPPAAVSPTASPHAFDACAALSGHRLAVRCVARSEDDRSTSNVAVGCRESSSTLPSTQRLPSATATMSNLTPLPTRFVAAGLRGTTRAALSKATSYPPDQNAAGLTPPLYHHFTTSAALEVTAGTTTTKLTGAQPSPIATAPMPIPVLRGARSVTLIPPLVRQNDRVAVGGEATLGSALHRRGRCALCGLDITDRTSMRRYLADLRRPAAGCRDDVLTRLTEHRLACLLGPLWGVVCDGGDGVLVHHNCLAWVGVLPTFTYRPFEMLCGATPQCTRQCVWSRSQTMPICIALPELMNVSSVPGLVQCRRKRPRAVQQRDVSIAALARLVSRLQSCDARRDSSRSLLYCCAVCGSSSVVGTRACIGMGRSACRHGNQSTSNLARTKMPCYFHLPCALLADESRCVVYGMAEDDDEGGNASTHRGAVLEMWVDKVAVRCGACRRAALP